MTSTQHQPSLVCNVKHHIPVDSSASVECSQHRKTAKAIFQYKIWNRLKLKKILSGKVYKMYVIQALCTIIFITQWQIQW